MVKITKIYFLLLRGQISYLLKSYFENLILLYFIYFSEDSESRIKAYPQKFFLIIFLNYSFYFVSFKKMEKSDFCTVIKHLHLRKNQS